ncbi:MAG: hypothetical protein R3C19_14180 [Planctomycetaceae bacterium]
MADKPKQQSKPPGVSPVRKIVSGVLLVALVAVAAIELRASLGQRQTAEALEKLSNDSTGERLPLEEAKKLISMSPKEELVSENDNYTEYCYSWFSLFRPGKLQVYVIADKTDPPKFISSATEPDKQMMSAPAGGADSSGPPMGPMGKRRTRRRHDRTGTGWLWRSGAWRCGRATPVDDTATDENATPEPNADEPDAAQADDAE